MTQKPRKINSKKPVFYRVKWLENLPIYGTVYIVKEYKCMPEILIDHPLLRSKQRISYIINHTKYGNLIDTDNKETLYINYIKQIKKVLNLNLKKNYNLLVEQDTVLLSDLNP